VTTTASTPETCLLGQGVGGERDHQAYRTLQRGVAQPQPHLMHHPAQNRAQCCAARPDEHELPYPRLWAHLRMCLSSYMWPAAIPARTGMPPCITTRSEHPVMQSAEQDENWRRCYQDQRLV
jgi:hypothetical protein